MLFHVTAHLSLSSFSSHFTGCHNPDAKGQAVPHLGAFKFQALVTREKKGQRHISSVSFSQRLALASPRPLCCCPSIVYQAESSCQPWGTSWGSSCQARQPFAGQCACSPQTRLTTARAMPTLNSPLLGGKVVPGNVKKEPMLKTSIHQAPTQSSGEISKSKEHQIRLHTQKSLLGTCLAAFHVVLLKVSGTLSVPPSALHQL